MEAADNRHLYATKPFVSGFRMADFVVPNIESKKIKTVGEVNDASLLLGEFETGFL